MGEFPKGGLIGKGAYLLRSIRALNIALYAANACYFIVLAAMPALLLLLGLLRYTPLEVERLGEILQGILPEPLLEPAEELILLTYDSASGTTVGLSALVALWSASRGIYGLITGLNAVYDVTESRGYFHIRLVSVGYTFAFLLVLILTLSLHVFGTELLGLLRRASHPFLRFLLGIIDLRFFLLLVLQTAVFTAMYMALPGRPNPFRESLPGALLASSGWLIFSDLYSVYVEHFAGVRSMYGSLSALSLSMLWLYCCMGIFFCGGGLNRWLAGK